MNIVAFNGSPRKGGNTEELLNKAIEGTEQDVRVFNLNKMDIKPCQNCGGCDETGVCIIEDEMSEIYTAIREAHRIIMATPVYFMGPSAQAKAMYDRCQAFWCEKYLLNKTIPTPEPTELGRKGLLLTVGGMKVDTGVVCVSKISTAFFRTISIKEHATLSYTNVDAKGEIFKHPNALNDALKAGAELVK